MQMFVQSGSSSLQSSTQELPVSLFQRALWDEVHFDERGFNRGYPVEVTMLLGGGEEIRELTGRDRRSADLGALATNAYRAAILTSPPDRLKRLQAYTERLHYLGQEVGDVLFHFTIGQQAHGVQLEEIVAARAQQVAPDNHTPVLTFGDFDELVNKYRHDFGLVLSSSGAYIDLETNSLAVVSTVGSQYQAAYEQLLKTTRVEGGRPVRDPTDHEDMLLYGGDLLWCLSWVAQFRLGSSLQEVAHRSLAKAVHRKQAGLAVMFNGSGDKR